MSKRIFIGVSWPYANGSLHIGHLAGQHIVVDVFRRYHKLKGHDVLMVSGSDMHGTPITTKAKAKGISPEEFALKNHKEIVKLFKDLKLEYDLYTKTHTQNHIKVSQIFADTLYKLGFLKKKTIKQFFDKKENKFLVDRYVEGTCPYCNYFPARGDQCDNCGHVLTPKELINPISKLSGETPILKQTTDLYLDLPRFEKELKTWLKNKTFWRKQTLNLANSWIQEGLKPRPITRDLEWGIPLRIKNFEHKVLYVWFEAVIGYLSAAILWAKKQGDESLWQRYWKDPKVEHYYFIGKDNIPFHTIIWPIQLIAFNKKYEQTWKDKELLLPGENEFTPLNLPYNVVANNFLNIKGEKMSKSKGTFITARQLIEEYSEELVRFFFTRYAPETHDIDFNSEKLKEANNNELVATIGNLIYRVYAFAKKNYGNIPDGKLDTKTKNIVEKYLHEIGTFVEKTQFSKATEQILKLAQIGNQIFNNAQPWKAPESKPAKDVVYNVIQLVEALNIIFKAFILHLSETIESYTPEYKRENKWQFKPIPSGVKIGEVIIPVAKKI